MQKFRSKNKEQSKEQEKMHDFREKKVLSESETHAHDSISKKIVVNGKEVLIDDEFDANINIPEYVENYMRAIPPLSLSSRSDRYLRGESPYFNISVFSRPPIAMKPPYNIDYSSFWKRYNVLRLHRETRHMRYSKPEIYVSYADDMEFIHYEPAVKKIADTAFLFVDIDKRDGVEVQTNTGVSNVIVPFDVFRAWLELEKSCTWLSPGTVARRMPAPLRGYLILRLNDEYQGIDLIRSESSKTEEAFDSTFVQLDPHTYETLKNKITRLDATTAFVEILKTAIKKASDTRLADISRLLNH
jgi:hypothetical protein